MSHSEISATAPDWQREYCSRFEWAPGRKLLQAIRDYEAHKTKSVLRTFPIIGMVVKSSIILRHRFWTAVSGADIPLNVKVGGGLLLPHPNGVVIHPDAVIGPNCLIMSQVVIGMLETDGTPNIGGHVDIGTGAKLLGPINIGEHVKVGANSVVIQDIPAHRTAVGIPAKII